MEEPALVRKVADHDSGRAAEQEVAEGEECFPGVPVHGVVVRGRSLESRAGSARSTLILGLLAPGGDDLLGDGERHRLVMLEVHREARLALAHVPHVGRVAEHRRPAAPSP